MRKSVLLIERGMPCSISIVKNVGINPPRNHAKLPLIRIGINDEKMTVQTQDAFDFTQTVLTVFSTKEICKSGIRNIYAVV